jgi:3-methyl-2-oxobutanoate hydroxymethyltransferase
MSKFTATSFAHYKEQNMRIVMCTAYDVSQARMAQAAGVDVILVGDSLGTTTLGYDSTIPVTMEDLLRATQAVAKGAPDTFIVADLPFMSYQVSFEEGMRNAGRLIKEGGAAAVKLEGASSGVLDLVEGLSSAGVPVIGHLGLTPQSVHALGGYKVQGKEAPAAAELLIGAQALAATGAVAVVLECIPVELARVITQRIESATIGIGAGPDCDGEVQVFHDMLGLGGDFKPRHAKRFVEGGELLTRGLSDYGRAVREGSFPAEAQSTHIDQQVVEDAQEIIEDLLASRFDDYDDIETSLV